MYGYRLFYPIVVHVLKHPMVRQLSLHRLLHMLQETGFSEVKAVEIDRGKQVIQFGFKVPTWLTPVQVYLVEATK